MRIKTLWILLLAIALPSALACDFRPGSKFTWKEKAAIWEEIEENVPHLVGSYMVPNNTFIPQGKWNVKAALGGIDRDVRRNLPPGMGFRWDIVTSSFTNSWRLDVDFKGKKNKGKAKQQFNGAFAPAGSEIKTYIIPLGGNLPFGAIIDWCGILKFDRFSSSES